MKHTPSSAPGLAPASLRIPRRTRTKTPRLCRIGAALALVALGVNTAACETGGLEPRPYAPHPNAAKTGVHRLHPGPDILPNYVTVSATEPDKRILPSEANDKESSKITRLLFTGLAYLDEKGQVKYDMANAILPNETCTMFDIEIKPDLYFSDGTVVKSYNFQQTWSDAVRNVATRPAATIFKPIRGYQQTATPPSQYPPDRTRSRIQNQHELSPDLEGVEVLSDTHFKVHLDQPACDFISRIATPIAAPLPPAAFDQSGKITASFAENPFGYGPYMLNREGAWERGAQLNLVPNERYQGPWRAHNEGISFQFYRDQDAPYKDLQQDGLDLDDNLPRAALKTYRDHLGSRSTLAYTTAVEYLVLESNDALAVETEAGKLRRQAISLSLNRAEILRNYFASIPIPAADFVSSPSKGHETVPGADILKNDAQRAKTLWNQANTLTPWAGTLVLARSENEPEEWLTDVANQIRTTLGINVRLTVYPDRQSLVKALANSAGSNKTPSDTNTIATRRHDSKTAAGKPERNDQNRPEKPQTTQFGYPSSWQPKYPQMGAYLEPLFATSGINNKTGYANPEIDRLLSQAGACVSVLMAHKIYSKVETMLFNDLPVIPLWYQKAVIGWSTKITNIHLDWQGIPQYWRITKN